MIHISSITWKKSGLDSNQITQLVTVFYSKELDDAVQNVLQGEDYYIARYMEPVMCAKSQREEQLMLDCVFRYPALQTDVSMDFVLSLPWTQRRADSILVVVDRLKMAHFIPFPKNHRHFECRKYLLKGVVGLHGLPRTITSDHDSSFFRSFLEDVMGENWYSVML